MADCVLYIPMHGQFILVQLETPEEAVLGRIATFSSEGKLTSSAGEEFNIRAVQEGRAIPEDLREQYLRYRVSIRVLGVVRADAGDNVLFVPSQRRLPHVGSPVAFPDDEVLREIAGHAESNGTTIGHLAFGEYVYSEGSEHTLLAPWMRVKGPEVRVRFHVENLVSRRSFIFARAGFGKSNLTKLLFSALYRETPTVEKRGGRKVPVGTIIFDPDGEYFWPDDRGRPGLCDVPELQDRLVVFTNRRGPSPFYQSFVAGGVKLDLRRLRASDVIGVALDLERQGQQNVRRLRNLSPERWEELINLVDEQGYDISQDDIIRILRLNKSQIVEANAALGNINAVVRMLHDRHSRLMESIDEALEAGKLCVVDLSLMRRGQSLILSGLILKHIFDRNQQAFTTAGQRTIPTIAVIEEAQAVLNEHDAAAEPYVAWVKEGRKYDLGAVLVTQQPGSIPSEILSQGDNWFIFHLLSAADLGNAQRANAHFSDDLLGALLNEPIPGQGVFWSSAGSRAYPLPFRALSFETMEEPRDPDYQLGAIETTASRMHARQRSVAAALRDITSEKGSGQSVDLGEDDTGSTELDEHTELRQLAIRLIQGDAEIMRRLHGPGCPWGEINALIRNRLPDDVHEPDDEAFRLVIASMNTIFGRRGWETHKPNGARGSWIRVVNGSSGEGDL